MSSEFQRRGKIGWGWKIEEKMAVNFPNLGGKLTCKPRDLRSWANHEQNKPNEIHTKTHGRSASEN